MAKGKNEILNLITESIKGVAQQATETTYTTRTWTEPRADGSIETITETKKDFTIKPSKTGAKLGALAGAAAGAVIGEYIPFIGGTVCAVICAIIGGVAGWIFGPA